MKPNFGILIDKAALLPGECKLLSCCQKCTCILKMGIFGAISWDNLIYSLSYKIYHLSSTSYTIDHCVFPLTQSTSLHTFRKGNESNSPFWASNFIKKSIFLRKLQNTTTSEKLTKTFFVKNSEICPKSSKESNLREYCVCF